ncbi:MAG: flagellar hook protein FlgE, partial [Thiovulaceae bacterium]|nr:flagellar hook protein FlgE [Sulfurimonadaceae bacterium]
SATEGITLKANLNSGTEVSSISPAYAVPSGPAPAAPTPPALDANGNPIESGDLGVMFNESGQAFSLQEDQGVWASFRSSTKTGVAAVAAGSQQLDITFTLDDGSTKQITTQPTLATNTAAQNAAVFQAAIDAQSSTTGINASYDGVTGLMSLVNNNNSESSSHNIRLTAVGATDSSGFAVGSTKGVEETAYRYQYNPTSATTLAGQDKTFTTVADFREALENEARDIDNDGLLNNITVAVSDSGKIEIENPGGSAEDYDINLQVTAITSMDGSGVVENPRFSDSVTGLSGVLNVASGGKARSQSLNVATHSSSIDIYDSLGSKHTLRMEFRKTALDSNTGSTWAMKISVPSPATIDTVAPYDEKVGSVRFNNDGSLASFDPPNISFSGNNGSASGQQVKLSFGTAGSFEGMTSYDSESTTSGISQDGYTGGDLVGIRIDQSGTLIGSFSNGRSFGLAQIGMAKFTNNEGLTTEGGNVYIQTANSGEPIIGTAATAGRGFMQASALEASNVDLSRSLTQLIIIQRGFQANGKTITTSDQLLQTLIGLKQ